MSSVTTSPKEPANTRTGHDVQSIQANTYLVFCCRHSLAHRLRSLDNEAGATEDRIPMTNRNTLWNNNVAPLPQTIFCVTVKRDVHERATCCLLLSTTHHEALPSLIDCSGQHQQQHGWTFIHSHRRCHLSSRVLHDAYRTAATRSSFCTSQEPRALKVTICTRVNNVLRPITYEMSHDVSPSGKASNKWLRKWQKTASLSVSPTGVYRLLPLNLDSNARSRADGTSPLCPKIQ